LGIPRLEVLAEQKHGGIGERGADLAGGDQTLVPMGGRHPDVHQRNVRDVRMNRTQQLPRFAALGHHIHAGSA
jgi:hypothetical protein